MMTSSDLLIEIVDIEEPKTQVFLSSPLAWSACQGEIRADVCAGGDVYTDIPYPTLTGPVSVVSPGATVPDLSPAAIDASIPEWLIQVSTRGE